MADYDQLRRGLARDFVRDSLQAGETGFFERNPVSESSEV
jgi:hypothetical protein